MHILNVIISTVDDRVYNTLPLHTQLHGKPPDYHTLCTWMELVVFSTYGFEQL